MDDLRASRCGPTSTGRDNSSGPELLSLPVTFWTLLGAALIYPLPHLSLPHRALLLRPSGKVPLDRPWRRRAWQVAQYECRQPAKTDWMRSAPRSPRAANMLDPEVVTTSTGQRPRRTSPAGMPSEAKLWRAVAVFAGVSLVATGAIGGGLVPALGLNFHLQSPASYAMALAVLMLLCFSIYCVYCSQ